MEKKGSGGIAIFGVLFMVYGIFGVLAFFTSLSMFGCRTIPFIFHIVMCATSLVESSFIIASVGILRSRNWARKLAMALSLIMILANISQAIFMATMGEAIDIVGIVIYYAINISTIIFLSYAIYFFTLQKVKEQFN